VRRALLFAVCALAVAAATAPVAAEETHRAELRVAYIERALAALRETPPSALAQASDYAHVLGRSTCSSVVQRLKVECLMTASRTYCKKKSSDEPQRCQVDMDVIVSKMLGDTEQLSTEKRYQIMTHYKDWRHELARQSRQQGGTLAVDFRLRTGEGGSDAIVAKSIDQYCLATADENAMPWQTCVSSLLWFIATEARTAEGAR
jgi:hypothetical protein